jgi:predicted  nucleic acid-binding Zn-ribbon protein
MSERKEPTFHGAGSDLDLHAADAKAARPAPMAERTPVAGRKAAEPTPTPPPRPRASATTPAAAGPVGGGSGLTMVALVLAFLGLASSGLLYAQLGTRFDKAQSDLAAADLRIVELESRLALSNNESDQSVTAIHEKLKWADAEIRKLWVLANERNRKAIETNTARIDQLSTSLKTATATIDAAKTSGTDAKKLADANATQIKQMGLQISAAAEQASQAFDDAAGSRKELQAMSTKLTAMDKSLAALKADLAGRVRSNEEAIRAIDAHRMKLNTDIQAIQARLGQ